MKSKKMQMKEFLDKKAKQFLKETEMTGMLGCVFRDNGVYGISTSCDPAEILLAYGFAYAQKEILKNNCNDKKKFAELEENAIKEFRKKYDFKSDGVH